MNRRTRTLMPALMGVLVAGALVFALLAGSGGSSGGSSGNSAAGSAAPPGGQGFDGAALPSGVVAPRFTLRRQDGGEVSLASLRGRPVVLAFLYSSCGGPCVVIAQQIRGALDELGRSPVSVVFVSADPRGDTPSNVRRFLGQVSLSGRVDYLTGTRQELGAVWRAYRVRPASAGRDVFGRFATVMLIDGKGRERVVFGTEQLTPDALAHDIRRLAPS